ncbi:RCC1 domain-containing protein [Actinophytocola gossypii]|uniref:RCC1-like domain-containing protein n=1 Tax=Actinophytocola gossypii TaxID=2812003 RepID=A0ABT2JHD2_9PSEU|nr:hypothetical protein [Actinophytocola gossypii]MCT2586689.1 hypothetical protein [Actinophytocola gossypii]
MRRSIVVLAVLALVGGFASAGQRADVPEPAPVAAETGSSFTPVTPVRVLDTRTGTGTPVGPRGTITLGLTSRVPAGATAVVLNVTGTGATAATHVTAFPSGTTRPNASNLNLAAGDTRPVLTTVALGADRAVSLYNHNGRVHLLADLAGYYAPGSGAKYTPLSPTRVLDTRQADDIPALGHGATQVVDLSGHVPASATAVTLNLTGVGSTAITYVTAWPTGRARPDASNLNLPVGSIRPNLVTVALGTDRTISLFNHVGRVDALVDLVGFYTPEYGATFVPVNPVRVLDTRAGTGTTAAGAIAPNSRIPVLPGTHVPADATAALLNVTGVEASRVTYVSVWSPDGRADDAVSTLNLGRGETAANLAAVTLSTMAGISAYNHQGSTHLIGDLAGVFVTPGAACPYRCAHTWGGNEAWALGTGERVPSSATPAPVVGLSGVLALAGGGANRYALREDGTVWAWGQNVFGQLGGDWRAIGWSAVPAPVPGLTDVTAIAAGVYHVLALRADGTVWAWGVNHEGGLGNGTAGSDTPVRVSGLTGVTAIAAGDHGGYALRSDGTVWAWGSNANGALGDASLAEYAQTPVRVSGLTGITAIAGGGYGGYAVRGDGTLWSWGSNRAGELGDGTRCDPRGGNGCLSRIPVRVSGLTEVTDVAGSPFTTGSTAYAVTDDGTAWTWGDGPGTNVPTRVPGLADVTDVAAGLHTGYARTADGSAWAWGQGTDGALGNGSDADSTVPVRVHLTGVTDISAAGALVATR